MKSTNGNKFIIVGIIAIILFWVAESILHIIFYHGTGLLDQIFSPGIHELWMRIFVIVLIFVVSYHAKRNFDIVRKRENIEDLVKIQRDISIRIGMDENIDDTLKTCIDAAIEISGMDCGGIYFVDEATGDFTLVHHKGLSNGFVKDAAYCSADSENARLIKLGIPNYFTRDKLAMVLSVKQQEEGLTSLAVIPVKSGDRVVAVLHVASHLHKEISNTVRDAIEGVAAQIGNVIDKARKANELIESEKKYRSIVENAHEGILIVDDDYKITYVNDELCRILQYDREELLGFDFTEVIDGEGREIVIDRYKRRQAGKDVPNRYEFNVFRKSGEQRNVEISSSVIKTKEGTFTIALILDLSLRKRAEKKYKTLFQSSKDSIAVIKPPEWEFVACNPATLELFGIDNENELLTKTPEETSPEYQPDGQKSSVKARKMIEIAVREGAHFFEWTHIDSGGSPIPTTVYLVRIEIEEEQCLLATIRDISESKNVELQLKQLRDYLTSIINSMPSVLIGVDPENLVTHWNQEAEKRTGIAAEDACGKLLLDVYPELEGEMDNVGMAISSGEIQKDLKVARYVNDEVCYKDITVYPIISGDISGVVIREDDVTEREKLQDVVAQAEKMNSLGGLAAGMAHEINTPLTAIIQNAAVALNRLMEDIPGNVKVADELDLDLSVLRKYVDRRAISEMIDGIRISGKRAAEIVRDMLSFARKEMPEKSAHSISSLLDNSVDLARQDVSLDVDDIKIRCEYDSDLPDIMCEPGKIKQVFFNIIKNGAEAMKKKEREGYNPEFILRTYRVDDWACVEIEDNGPGIEESVRKRVFEPFFTTKEEVEGAGLGMSVSYFIVTETHAGMMEVESRKGQWTRFVIKLPFDA